MNMQNWVWYFILTVVSIIIAGFTFFKKRNLKLVPFYFFLSAIIIYLEFVIMIIFESYTYYPKVLEDAYFDSILGGIVSDFFSVPAVAFAIAAFQLNHIWIALGSIIFMGIEYAFVKLQIYVHHWWKTIYTGVGLLIHFKIAKQFWKSLIQNPPKRYIRIISLYSSYHVIHGLLAFVLVVNFNLFYFHPGWVSNPSRDHMIFNVIYTIIISSIAAIIVGFKLKWYFRALGILLTYGFDWSLVKLSILYIPSKFSINIFLIIHLIILGIIVVLNSILIKEHRAID